MKYSENKIEDLDQRAKINDFKYHYLYKITNLLNNKIYIGIHSTNNLNDGYMGSSKILKNAIRKHGLQNFNKEILSFYESREDLREAEHEIVNAEFIKRKDTYNQNIGGNGGDSYEAYLARKSEDFIKKSKEFNLGKIWITDGISKNTRIYPNETIPEGFYKGKTDFNSRYFKSSDSDAVIYSREYLRSIGKGSKWVNNGEISKRILEGEEIPEGFTEGRLSLPKGNKGRKFIFKEGAFKLVTPDLLPMYLNDGWIEASPADSSTNSNYSRNVKIKHRKKSEELLKLINDVGISESFLRNMTPDEERQATRKLIDLGILHEANAYRVLVRYLPEFFRENKKGTTWITDGTNNKKHPIDRPIPEGWRKGTTIRQGPNKNLK